MAGFSSYDNMISKITASGQYADSNFFKSSGTMHGAGTWASLWRVASLPAAGNDTGGALDNYAGSMNWAAQSPMTKHLITFGGVSSLLGTLMLYDRLAQVPSIVTTSTGDKAVNTAALTRYTDGVGVQCWLEVTAATTATAPIVHLHAYTDNDNNPNQDSVTSYTFPAAATVLNSFLGPLPILAADTGVRVVTTLNVSQASTLGTVSVVLIKPLAFLPLLANTWNERDLVLQLAAMPRAYDTASLALAFCPNAVTAVNIWGMIRMAYN